MTTNQIPLNKNLLYVVLRRNVNKKKINWRISFSKQYVLLEYIDISWSLWWITSQSTVNKVNRQTRVWLTTSNHYQVQTRSSWQYISKIVESNICHLEYIWNYVWIFDAWLIFRTIPSRENQLIHTSLNWTLKSVTQQCSNIKNNVFF